MERGFRVLLGSLIVLGGVVQLTTHSTSALFSFGVLSLLGAWMLWMGFRGP